MTIHGKHAETKVKMPQVERGRLYSFARCAELSDVSAFSWRKWARDGKVQTILLGRRRLVPESEYLRLIGGESRP
jgi:hypothetical protein